MPILGIDPKKCTQCGSCIQACSQICFSHDTETKQVVFADLRKWCFLCGHCLASCPTNAILYDNMGGPAIEIPGVENPQQFLPYTTLQPFLRSIRSIRYYKPDPVPDTVLQQVYDAMRYAPSATNMRAWEFKILSDPIMIAQLSEQIQDALLHNPGLAQKYEQKFSARKAKGVKDPIFFAAPHVLFVYSSLVMEMEAINTGIILTYANLTAKSLGLGTCWIGLAQLMLEENPPLKKALKIHGKCYGVITLGYPAITYKRLPPRAELRVKLIKSKEKPD